MLEAASIVLLVVLVFATLRYRSQVKILKTELLKLEKVDSTQSQLALVGRVSHEIRTSLYAIIGAIDTFDKANLDTVSQNKLTMIGNGATNLIDLLSSAIDYTKLNSSELEVKLELIPIYEVLESTIKIFYLSAEKKGLEFNYNIDPKIYQNSIVSDRMLLKQILSNLVGNAIKYTDSGSIELSAFLRQADDKNATLSIFVNDTGIGFNSEDLAHPFDRNTLIGQHGDSEQSSSGIGLSITKSMVHLLEGTINISNKKVESGAEITLHFPVKYEKQLKNTSIESLYKGKTISICSRNVGFESTMQLATSLGTKVEMYNEFTNKIILQSPDLLVVEECTLNETKAKILVSAIESGKIEKLVVVQCSGNITQHEKQLLKHTKLHPLLPSDFAAFLNEDSKDPDMFTSSTSDIRVLCVDDNEINREIIREQLSKIGIHNVLMAEDGIQAVEQFASADIILMDSQMPNMDGLEATKTIRSANSSVPIIGITANTISEFSEQAKVAGMNAILYKPVTFESLKTYIAKFCTATTN